MWARPVSTSGAVRAPYEPTRLGALRAAREALPRRAHTAVAAAPLGPAADQASVIVRVVPSELAANLVSGRGAGPLSTVPTMPVAS